MVSGCLRVCGEDPSPGGSAFFRNHRQRPMSMTAVILCHDVGEFFRSINGAGLLKNNGINGTGVLGLALGASFVFALNVQGRDELIENSPFVPEGFEDPAERQPEPEPEPAPEPVDEALDSLQLRGITVMGEVIRFSLYDPERDEGFWLSVDETEAGYTVTDFEESSDSVRVRYGERERSLTLHEAEVGELSQEEVERMRSERREQREAAETAVEQPSSRDQGVESNASDSTESRDDRLQRAAQELRQRRAVRGGGDQESN